MSDAAPARLGRLPWLDTARGAALVAMAIYHGAWDMSVLGLTNVDIYSSPGWTVFARCIAASFLCLVGVSLVAADRRGVGRAAFLRRLAWIVGAAAVISAATLIAVPTTPILFGILHSIALASVLGLVFVRLSGWISLALAPVVATLPYWSGLALDHPALLWLGLRSAPPTSLDYVPLFPWFAATLFGIAAAKLVPVLVERPGLSVPALGWLGRHSLAVYVLHQPILLAILYPISLLARV